MNESEGTRQTGKAEGMSPVRKQVCGSQGHKRKPKRPRVGVIGAGRVGCAWAWHCLRLGYPFAGFSDKRPKQAQAGYRRLRRRPQQLSVPALVAASDVLFLTVPDAQIGSVFESVRGVLARDRGGRIRIVVHCSGAFGTEVFVRTSEPRVGALALHPVQAFSDASQAIRVLPGSHFVADGSNDGLRFGRRLVRELRGSWVQVRGSERPLYHAMCVFASNFVNALYGAAEEIAIKLEVSPRQAVRMLPPLTRTVLDNIAAQGAETSLTGPVERGDALTVARHLAALRRRAPALVPLYQTLAQQLVRLARQKGLPDKAIAELHRVLEQA